MPLLAFRKTTPEGLSVDVERFDIEGVSIDVLILTKEAPNGKARCAQVIGIAGKEVNTPGVTWYYEYKPLPWTISKPKLVRFLESRSYIVGTFDQFGNFVPKQPK